MPVRTICLHGPESVGKSVLAAQLAGQLGAEMVAEYGRDYCEAHGTDLDMGDLLEIARPEGGQTVFLPFTAANVPSVEPEAGRIVIDPPAGLFEEADDE